jgi:hypothetical protein
MRCDEREAAAGCHPELSVVLICLPVRRGKEVEEVYKLIVELYPYLLSLQLDRFVVNHTLEGKLAQIPILAGILFPELAQEGVVEEEAEDGWEGLNLSHLVGIDQCRERRCLLGLRTAFGSAVVRFPKCGWAECSG